MNLEELYGSYSTGEDCRELIEQSDWLSSFVDFDPMTGETLPMSLNKVLRRISTPKPSTALKDRLWLITSHSEESARRLMNALSEEARREPAYLPIRQVRELDTASFIALTRRPGRNIREKLADKPYMQAVRHFQSVDIPENRLLKTYLLKLSDVLELRKKYLEDKEVENFLQSIYRWLNEDKVREISLFENLAPNNTLLSHRDFRKVWNSWCWLQTLDDDVNSDFLDLSKRRKTKRKWENLSEQYASGSTIYADMPVLVDFSSFCIKPWIEPLPTLQVSGSSRNAVFFETNEPVCIDLTQLQPVYATPSESGKLNDNFIWQRWSSKDTSVELELFESDAVNVLSKDAQTITCSDIFFREKSGDKVSPKTNEVLNQASRIFCERLHKHFHNALIFWITPDLLNEFELEHVRRNINASFSQAEPLPCSVAAVFDHIDYNAIDKDGYRVAVVERLNGKAYLTELVARFDENLSSKLPETCGYIWEKGLTELLSEDVESDRVEANLYLLDKNSSWTREVNPYGVMHKKEDDILMPYEGYDLLIWLNARPVNGGIKLYQRQSQVKDIPLWRSRIPQLKTKVIKNGRYQSFYFVGKDVTVQPVRGKAICIDVPDIFTLPKGKKVYRLPLLQGTKEEALEYEARLESKDFPYMEDVKCRLNMTYTYGADDPFKLVFQPLDKNYKKVNVIWQRKEDVEIDDAPAPSYPTEIGWSGVRRQFNPKKQEDTDLTEWALSSTENLIKEVSRLESELVKGAVSSGWRRNEKGNLYTFANSSQGVKLSNYINESSLIGALKPDEISEGDTVYFFSERQKRGYCARFVSKRAKDSKNAISQKVVEYIHRAMYVPFINIWGDGRSSSDKECPSKFRKEIPRIAEKLLNIISLNGLSDNLKNEAIFLLCCMGKDMPPHAVEHVITSTQERKLDAKSMGFSLGDLSTDWQKEILRELLSQCNGPELRALAYAIWRSKSFINMFSYKELVSILRTLASKIARNTKELKKKKDPKRRKSQVTKLTRYLELLMGLLRTRESKTEKIRRLLQPGQDFTIQFAESVNNLIADAKKNNDVYFTRLKIDFSDRTESTLTPDLLYALKVYLEGDLEASAIRVAGVDDVEE